MPKPVGIAFSKFGSKMVASDFDEIDDDDDLYCETLPGKRKSSAKFINKDFGQRKLIHVGMNRQLSFGKKGNKQWIHPPDTLLRGHMVYNVKFLGDVEVDQPKGTEVVREAIRKMKFNKQLKKAEGQKPPKVELTISVDGVTVQDPKLKVVQHQYPLHRISYCADDKADKRMFTFIAKEGDGNRHQCYVFDSEKCAEEITLTIGQAFDLAYKKFMESSSKDIDMKKQLLLLQKKIQTLTHENVSLKGRVADLERLVDPKALEEFETNKNNPNATYASVSPVAARPSQTSCHSIPLSSGQSKSSNPQVIISPKNATNPFLTTPPRLSPPISTGRRSTGTRGQVTNGQQPVVGRKLENLIMEDESPSQSIQTNGTPSAAGSVMPMLAPPPPVPSRSHQPHPIPDSTTSQPAAEVDLFGLTPFTPSPASAPANHPVTSPVLSPSFVPTPALTSPSNPFGPPMTSAPFTGPTDPFGMEAFNPGQHPQNIDQEILRVDRELLDLQSGFSQGLSLGTEDFNLADLDPLNKK